MPVSSTSAVERIARVASAIDMEWEAHIDGRCDLAARSESRTKRWRLPVMRRYGNG
jgi:hypothetical protein